MIKSIGYAYPTSLMAKRMGDKSRGGYYVATYPDETDPNEIELFGPFETIEAAEVRAETVEGRWSRFTKRAPAKVA